MIVRRRTFATKAGEQVRYLADYRDSAGARRFRQFATEGAARSFLERVKVEVEDRQHVADSQSKTVAKAAELWLEFCAVGDPTGDPGPIEPSTLREYKRYVRYATDPAIGIGAIRLTKLSAADVDGFLVKLRQRGHSAAIARKVRTALSTLLNFALDRRRGWVARNVLAEGPRSKGRRPRDHEEVAVPTKAELRAMLDADAPLWFRAFLTTAIYTGMRASELRGLPWRHVGFELGVIRVRQRADFAGVIGPPKSRKGNREIPMAPTVRRLLTELFLAAGRPADGLVFASATGRPIYHTNIMVRHFEPLQRELGIARYGLHALRHAAASLFIEQGWSPKKVQTVMGHSSIRMTFDRYGHLFRDEEEDQAAMARLEASLG